MNVVFVGDLLQLPPINGLPVFCKLTNRAVSSKFGYMRSVNIWRDTVTYDELIINERQKRIQCILNYWVKFVVAVHLKIA